MGGLLSERGSRGALLVKLVAAFTLVMLSGLSAACDYYPYRIGIESETDGSLVIHVRPCRGEPLLVSRVALARSGERNSPLWEIRSVDPNGEGLLRYKLGVTPPSFVENAGQSGPLERGRYLAIVDSSILRDQSYSFRLADLEPGIVLAGDGQYLSQEQFEAGEGCR